MRDVADMAAAPWRSLARVVVAGEMRCTGFVIAPDRVATAAHCLFSRRLGRFVPPSAVHVQVGYGRGAMAEHRVAARYRTGDGFDPRAGPAFAGMDVAVLVLSHALAAPALAVEPGQVGPAALGGYGKARPEVLQADQDCRVRGMARDKAGRILLAHDCAGGMGTSGAPLLQRGDDGQWRAVGVQAAGEAASGAGYAVPAAVLRDLAR
jgi:protease YdgD